MIARTPGRRAALGMVLLGLAWDQLFLAYDVIPGTAPPAIVLLAAGRARRVWKGAQRRARGWPSGEPAAPLQGDSDVIDCVTPSR